MLYRLIAILSIVTLSLAIGDQICLGGSAWDGAKCSCSLNMVNVNGKCFCDYGFWQVGVGCMRCDSNNNYYGQSCQGNSTSCPSGQSWNGNVCALNWRVDNCGQGLYWNGLFCQRITSAAFTCQPGFSWNGQACIIISVPKCVPGNYFDGQVCTQFINPPVCKDGFSWNALTGICYIRQTQNCAYNLYWNGKQCAVKGDIPPKCSAGHYWNGQACEFVGISWTPVCAAGFIWAGRSCKPTLNRICDSGFQLDPFGSSCVIRSCPAGQVLVPNTQICISANGNSNIDIPSPTVPRQLFSRFGNSSLGVNANRGFEVPGLNGNIRVNPSGTVTLPNGTVIGGPNSNINLQPRGLGLGARSFSPGGKAISGPGFNSFARPGATVVNGVTVRSSAPRVSGVLGSNRSAAATGGASLSTGGLAVGLGGVSPKVSVSAKVNASPPATKTSNSNSSKNSNSNSTTGSQ